MSNRQMSIVSNVIRTEGDEQMQWRITTEPAGFEEGKIKGSAPASHKSLSRLVLVGACRSCGWRLILTIHDPCATTIMTSSCVRERSAAGARRQNLSSISSRVQSANQPAASCLPEQQGTLLRRAVPPLAGDATPMAAPSFPPPRDASRSRRRSSAIEAWPAVQRP